MRSYRSPRLAMVALSVIINAGLTVAQTNSRAPTQAQASTDLEVGDIAVAVSDASGAVVPNAIVQVTTEIGQVRVLGTTDGNWPIEKRTSRWLLQARSMG